MARDISIAISVKDNYTQAITTMRNANQGFNKDIEGLTQRLRALDTTRASLKIDTSQLRRDLQAAQRQFNETGSEADRMALALAEADYENANRNLRLVSQNAREAEKALRDMGDSGSRASNRAGGEGVQTAAGIAGTLAKAGLFKMVGDSFAEAANAGISSAFGSNLGDAISTTLSGAMTGAAIGSIVPGVGTAVGALVGTMAGGISAGVGYFQKDEEAYKASRQELVEGALSNQQADLQAGSGIAARRETDQVSFSTLLGTKEAAGAYLSEMQNMANITPFLYDDLAQMSKTLLTYGYKQDQLLPQLTMVGDTGAALGMSTADMTMVATGLGRMYNSDKATLEYLNLLIERGIPAIDYLAEDSGKTIKEVYEGISKGEISGKDAAAVISYYLSDAYSGAMERQSKTFAGMTSTLEGLNQELQVAAGEGYNERRLEDMRTERAWLEGDAAEGIKEANRLYGEWAASLEGERERLLREHIDAALASEEYQKALADEENGGAEAGRIIAQARIDAEIAYNETEGAKLMAESQKSLIEQTSKTLADEPAIYEAGRAVGDAYSKGILDATRDNMEGLSEGITLYEAFGGSTGYYARQLYNGSGIGDGYLPPAKADESSSGGIGKGRRPVDEMLAGNAWGLGYVPYDNYRTRLHEGERVLTAQENREYSSGQSGSVTISGNNFYVREEQDIYKIAQQLATELRKAQMISKGEIRNG